MFDRAINSLKSANHKNVMDDMKNNFIAYLEDCLHDDAQIVSELFVKVFCNQFHELKSNVNAKLFYT